MKKDKGAPYCMILYAALRCSTLGLDGRGEVWWGGGMGQHFKRLIESAVVRVMRPLPSWALHLGGIIAGFSLVAAIFRHFGNSAISGLDVALLVMSLVVGPACIVALDHRKHSTVTSPPAPPPDHECPQ